MRPIDYAIKLMIADNMKSEYFYDLVTSLYYEDNKFISEVLNILEKDDKDVEYHVSYELDQMVNYWAFGQ